MLTTDALRAWGANVDEGLARCLNDEAFYLKVVAMGLADANFDRLDAAVQAGDARGAFEAAHALKGSTGNLALTPLYAPVCALIETLRHQTAMPDVDKLYQEITAALAGVRRLL